MGEIVKIDSTNFIDVIHSLGSAIADHKPYSHQVYLIDIHVAGTSHIENIAEWEPKIAIDTRLNFYRESENQHDGFAIRIEDEAHHKLGYVPQDRNIILARLMDAGKLIYGTVYDKKYEGKWLKISLRVYLGD